MLYFMLVDVNLTI